MAHGIGCLLFYFKEGLLASMLAGLEQHSKVRLRISCEGRRLSLLSNEEGGR